MQNKKYEITGPLPVDPIKSARKKILKCLETGSRHLRYSPYHRLRSGLVKNMMHMFDVGGTLEERFDRMMRAFPKGFKDRRRRQIMNGSRRALEATMNRIRKYEQLRTEH